MPAIHTDFVNYKSTPVFTSDNIPKMFLHLHNTRAGVYGQINVLSGELKFYGFTERRGAIEQEIVIKQGEIAVSPPEYWHKVEFMTDDTSFRVDFYAQQDSDIVAENRSERND
ncbi:DUF1971 domain-containing protein [Moritella sp. Urea-trap-13]|uniref:DUF1971 domain-containing protein n=1 Tax=Moritella sp. Urea-trap-13 TaxID=2058327 RepID=UPI000C32FCDB|nr:DUF1971 domain-containing protein [Moritella sp. Urea-trap-13]PKH05911.1 cytoplasmic protein [Moritella sp. Urea-trap-13]